MDKNEITPMFNQHNAIESSVDSPLLLTMIRHIEDADVLELGCGEGVHVPFFVQNQAGKYIGIDASRSNIAAAASKFNHQSISFICHSPESFTGFTENFDIVTSVEIINDITDLRSFFRNVCVALRPDGQFIFSTTHPSLSISRHSFSLLINTLIECGFVIQRILELKTSASVSSPDSLLVQVYKHETAI